MFYDLQIWKDKLKSQAHQGKQSAIRKYSSLPAESKYKLPVKETMILGFKLSLFFIRVQCHAVNLK